MDLSLRLAQSHFVGFAMILLKYLRSEMGPELGFRFGESKKIRNDQELIQSDPTSCPQNQKRNN